MAALVKITHAREARLGAPSWSAQLTVASLPSNADTTLRLEVQQKAVLGLQRVLLAIPEQEAPSRVKATENGLKRVDVRAQAA